MYPGQQQRKKIIVMRKGCVVMYANMLTNI